MYKLIKKYLKVKKIITVSWDSNPLRHAFGQRNFGQLRRASLMVHYNFFTNFLGSVRNLINYI